MSIILKSVLASMLAVMSLGVFAEVAKPVKKDVALPAIWNNVQAQERFKCVRVAQMDAYRALAERIYGFQISSGTSVYNFVLLSDVVRTKMEALLKGAAEIEKPKYLEDGTVQVVYGVNLREVYEIIETEKESNPGLTKITITKELKKEDKLIEALGCGALPGSEGRRIIRAKRAAENDAYRLMAERFVGVKIDSKTTVKDLCLNSDMILGSVATFLKGLKPISIEYGTDGGCEVTVQLKIREIVDTVETLVKMTDRGGAITKETITQSNRDINEKLFTVTGRGTAKDETIVEPASIDNAVSCSGAFQYEKTILRKVISKGPVID